MKPCKHPCCSDAGPCRKPKAPTTRQRVSKIQRSGVAMGVEKGAAITGARIGLKSVKPKRVKLVPVPKLLKKTETVVNLYVRLRDKGQACISCGSENANQAGHYIAVNLCSFLRYDERNVHLQCPGCNLYKHGNPIEYRINLRKKLGEFEMERLERDFMENRRHKWTRTELEAIIQTYSSKIKAMQK